MTLEPRGLFAGLGQKLAALHVPLRRDVGGDDTHFAGVAPDYVRDDVGELRNDARLLVVAPPRPDRAEHEGGLTPRERIGWCTGAPASFVHAFFAELPAAELPEGKAAFVLGSIRWGRTDEQKARIVSELGESVATALGCRPEEVGVATADVPSRWNMEGGELLPEPGEEAEWLARHR